MQIKFDEAKFRCRRRRRRRVLLYFPIDDADDDKRRGGGDYMPTPLDLFFFFLFFFSIDGRITKGGQMFTNILPPRPLHSLLFRRRNI